MCGQRPPVSDRRRLSPEPPIFTEHLCPGRTYSLFSRLHHVRFTSNGAETVAPEGDVRYIGHMESAGRPLAAGPERREPMLTIWLRVQAEMRAHMRVLLRDASREKGQTMAEYAFLLALIAMIVIAGVIVLGDTLLEFYNDFVAEIP